jgi:hypothetical protein
MWIARWSVSVVAAASAVLGATGGAGAADEWLALGSKHWTPTITSKSGIGTAHARAEARVTRKGPGGSPEYDVRLDNGQRGILPPRMVRKAP